MARIINNGKAYDSGDVQAALFGRVDWEFTGINYATEQEHQANHSLGSNHQTSFSMGKVTHTADITLRLASASTIEKAAGGSLLNIKPFPINVTYINDDNDIVNDTIIAKFQSQGREVGVDMDLKKQYTLFVLDIKYNNI